VAGNPGSALLRRVGARIAELRRHRGLTQEALAERIESNVKHLQRIERGDENLTLRSVEWIATVLGAVPLDLLLTPARAERRTGRPRRTEQPARAVVHRAPADPARVTTAIPMLTLVAVAGEADTTSPATFVDWVEVPGRRLARGLFVARVEGESMAPRIPDGAHALFRSNVADDVDGRVVLVEIAAGEGYAQATYLLKRLQVIERGEDDAARVRLVSLNARVRPRTLWVGPGREARVVAELIEVLDEGPSG